MIVNTILIIGSLAFGFLILYIYDNLRYSKEIKFLKQIKTYVKKQCKESYAKKSIQIEGLHLSEIEKTFLIEFSEFVGCQNMKYYLNSPIKKFFCIKNTQFQYANNFNKISYLLDDYYCTSDVWKILYFIDEKYYHFLDTQEVESIQSLNEKLFGQSTIDDNELVDYILNMKLLSFVQKFSFLNQ